MKRTVERKFSALSLRMNTQFPFIHFDVCHIMYSVNGKSCDFSIKGILLTLILALLPRWWDACPWNTVTGIAVGTVIAVLWTVFAFIRFRAKMRKLDETAACEPKPEVYHKAPPPRQKSIDIKAPTTKFDVTKKYFIAKCNAEIAVVQKEGCRYLMLAETASDMMLWIADSDMKHFEPSLCHIDTVVQLANRLECDRVRMITDSGAYNRPLTDITSQPYNDLLEDTFKAQDELFVVVTYSEEGAYYITTHDNLIACLSLTDADALALQRVQAHSGRVEVRSVNIQELRDIVARLDGLCILDGSKTMLYDKPNTHVLPILDRITHHD